jgi:hypothetical protein
MSACWLMSQRGLTFVLLQGFLLLIYVKKFVEKHRVHGPSSP